MYDAVDYLFSFYLLPDLLYQKRDLDFFSSYDSLYPFLFQLAFEDGEHTFYRIGIWAVGWSKDVLKAKLVYPFDGCITVMYSQVVHDKADVIKEVSSS
jgi:hypothetical protein